MPYGRVSEKVDWRGRRLEAVAEVFVWSGIQYRLLVDGEEVARKANYFKLPGRYVVRANVQADGEARQVAAVFRSGLLRTTISLELDLDPEPVLDTPDAGKSVVRRRRFGKVFVASIVGFVVICSMSAVPTCRWRVAASVVPFSDRSGRQPARCDTLATRGGCEPVHVEGAEHEEVAFPSTHPDRGLRTLRGSLLVPRGAEPPHPGAVLIGGSGPISRMPELRGGLVVQHEPFMLYREIARQLLSQGLAVLVYDKRTCRRCYPDGSPDLARFRFEHFEDDARDALAYLRRREDIDGKNLVLVGHSQGGGIVARIGAEEEGVAAVIMLAGSTAAFRDGLPGQLRRFADVRLAQLDLIVPAATRFQAWRFESCLEDARAEPDVVQTCLHNSTAAAWDAEAQRSATTRESIESLDVPFLGLQGQLDINVDAENLRELREPLRQRNAELHIIEGVGHTLVHQDDRGQPRLAESVAEVVREFIRSVPRRQAR
ncbi:MAG: alpha/beta fold hydrolase [Deltaproteobacteria bacterium]|jgi:alpha-beta hydrolase superfamily lysophospholipase|nr:alpha/beta fold hydrolase [Deltaproteobacteria bacterium]MBW2535746.1 alpha/beta fold hydrolase [Deltaproteobacteria bacterium]